MNTMRALLILVSVPFFAQAADWPQWLGPRRDGSATDIIQPWSEAPKVMWRAPVGEGHSSPVVANGRVYLHHKVAGKEVEVLTIYDAATGKVQAEYFHERTPYKGQFGAGPRATPAVAPDGQVVSFGISGSLNSDVVNSWGLPVLLHFNAPNLRFGISGSPLFDGDRVIVPVGSKGASVVAFDRKTSQVIWKALDDAASYSSPIIIDHGGRRQLIQLTAAGLVSLAPADGAVYWQFPFKDVLQESSATPCKVGDLMIASSVTLGSIAVKLTNKEGKPAVEQAWKNPALSCYFSTPVPVGENHVYMVTGSFAAVMRGQPQADLCCVEAATGKLLWKQDKVGKYHAALLRLGDNKLLLHSDSGELRLIDPDANVYRELARATICGPTWAHPALSDGRLYVRDEKELICLQLPR